MSIRSLAAGVMIGASITAAVGIAYAAIPDSNGVVHACYQNVSGASKPVKLLDTGKATTCPSGWKAVSWNQKGVQGPPGIQGQPGQNGTDGTDGTSVVARLRATTPFAIPADNQPHEVPITGSPWNQPATADQELIPGTVTVTAPTTCTFNGNSQASTPLYVNVQYNLHNEAFLTNVSVPNGQQLTFQLPNYTDGGVNPVSLFEPGAGGASDSVTVVVSIGCNGGGPSATLDSLGMDVAQMQ
jgi:hypothetical protein